MNSDFSSLGRVGVTIWARVDCCLSLLVLISSIAWNSVWQTMRLWVREPLCQFNFFCCGFGLLINFSLLILNKYTWIAVYHCRFCLAPFLCTQLINQEVKGSSPSFINSIIYIMGSRRCCDCWYWRVTHKLLSIQEMTSLMVLFNSIPMAFSW